MGAVRAAGPPSGAVFEEGKSETAFGNVLATPTVSTAVEQKGRDCVSLKPKDPKDLAVERRLGTMNRFVRIHRAPSGEVKELKLVSIPIG